MANKHENIQSGRPKPTRELVRGHPDLGKTLFSAICTGVFLLLLMSTFYFLFHAPVLGIQTAWNEKTHAWEVAEADPKCPLKQGDRLLQIEDLKPGFLHLLTDNIHISERSAIFAWFEAKLSVYERLSRPVVHVLFVRDGHVMQAEVQVRGAHALLEAERHGTRFCRGMLYAGSGRHGQHRRPVAFIQACVLLAIRLRHACFPSERQHALLWRQSSAAVHTLRG